MLPGWRGNAEPEHDLFWEHEGNAAVRRGRWKLVRKFPGPWELYDMIEDRAELVDRASALPRIVQELAQAFGRWAEDCRVIPRENIVREYAKRGSTLEVESQGVSSTVTDPLWTGVTSPTSKAP
jgi:arylsulfatase